MKKIIASLTEGENYKVAENSARAPYFVVFEDGRYVKTIKNPFQVGGGAGFAVAELLKDEGCNVFVAKRIGGNMQNMLEEYGIDVEIN